MLPQFQAGQSLATNQLNLPGTPRCGEATYDLRSLGQVSAFTSPGGLLTNADAFALNGDGIFAVADGVSQSDGPDVASAVAAQRIVESRRPLDAISFLEAQRSVVSQAPGGQTVLGAISVYPGGQLVFGVVGDIECWIFRKRDNGSYRLERPSSSSADPAEAPATLGASHFPEPEIHAIEQPLAPGDGFLLLCDGLGRYFQNYPVQLENLLRNRENAEEKRSAIQEDAQGRLNAFRWRNEQGGRLSRRLRIPESFPMAGSFIDGAGLIYASQEAPRSEAIGYFGVEDNQTALVFEFHGAAVSSAPASKSVTMPDRLAESGIQPELVEAISDLGSYAVDQPFIEERLDLLQRDYGLHAILLAAGWAVLSDQGRGLWPTATFRNAWISFKEGHPNAAALTRSGNFFELLALSLSCPELLDEKQNAWIERERLKRAGRYGSLAIADDLRRFNDEGFRSLQMVGSYLGVRPDLPWKEADAARIETAVHEILLRNLDELLEWEEKKNRKIPGPTEPLPDSWDGIYEPAAEFDRNHEFRNAVHLGWHARGGPFDLPMPESAVRLNIEMPNDEFYALLALSAKSLSRVVAAGHHVSVKFTDTDHRGEPGFWQRLCIYVPTCAVPVMMEAFAPLFDGEKLQWTRRVQASEFCGNFYVLLPRYCSLRGSGEGGESSSAQFQESLAAVASLGITHQVLRKIG